jgi:hypothetical protein
MPEDGFSCCPRPELTRAWAMDGGRSAGVTPYRTYFLIDQWDPLCRVAVPADAQWAQRAQQTRSGDAQVSTVTSPANGLDEHYD